MASNSYQPTLDPQRDLRQPHNPQPSITQARRRLSVRQPQGAGMLHRDFINDSYSGLIQEHNHVHLGVKNKLVQDHPDSISDASPEESDIFLRSSTEDVKKMISPFLAKHIPLQYNPQGQGDKPQPAIAPDQSNTKFCYRHRPDLKCRRQVDEPSMDQLQSELATLSQADQQAISHVWSLFSAAPSKHRQLMLQGVLAQCCFPQLSFVSASVKNLIKIDFLSALPPELGFKILCHLDTASLCRAAQVSQRWRTMADDDVVWHRMCEQHIDRKCTKCGWGLPLLEQKRLRAEKRQVQLRAAGHGVPNNSTSRPHTLPEAGPQTESQWNAAAGSSTPAKRALPDDSSFTTEPAAKRSCTKSEDSGIEPPKPRQKRPWKDVYKDRFKVGTNWKYGRCSMKTFKGHTNGVMCLQFDDNILATGSYDTTVKIWDIESGKELRTLSGHTAGIRCLQFDDNRLFTGSIDRTLKVWNWRTGECIKTFTGPAGGIIGLHYSNKILACGSMDHTIRIWNLQDKSTFLLRGHTDWVNAVRIDSESRTIFSASDDCTIRLWDLDTRRCISVFKGHVGQVQQVLPLPHEFELGEEDEAFVAQSQTHDSDLETSDAGASSLEPFPSPSFSRDCRRSMTPSASDKPAPPRYMLTGALDGTIRLWHVPTGRCIRTFFGHVEGIWALAADTLRLVSGAEDRMVKVWDSRTGACERTFTGHAGPVTCVGLSDSRFATGSEDCEVRVYSFIGEDVLRMGQMGEGGIAADGGRSGSTSS